MSKFIELTRRENTIVGISDTKIRVNVENIEFYYDKCIVFGLRSIEVFESYDEITKLLEE